MWSFCCTSVSLHERLAYSRVAIVYYFRNINFKGLEAQSVSLHEKSNIMERATKSILKFMDLFCRQYGDR